MTEFQKDKVKNYLEEIENIIDDLRPKINGFDGLEKDIMQSVLNQLQRAYGEMEIMFDN